MDRSSSARPVPDQRGNIDVAPFSGDIALRMCGKRRVRRSIVAQIGLVLNQSFKQMELIKALR